MSSPAFVGCDPTRRGAPLLAARDTAPPLLDAHRRRRWRRLAFGAATAGGDALARHGSPPARRGPRADVPTGRLATRTLAGGRRSRNVSDDQEPFREGDIRVREFNAGALVNFRQVRRVQTLAGTFHAASEHVECEACTPALVEDATRRALRAGWAFDGSRRYGYSISDEEGLGASPSGEWTARAFGADGDAGAVVADLRGYLSLGPRHAALAGRVAGAHAWGDEAVRRVFGAEAAGPRCRSSLSTSTRSRYCVDSTLLTSAAGMPSSRTSTTGCRSCGSNGERARGRSSSGLHGALFSDFGSAWNDSRERQSGVRRLALSYRPTSSSAPALTVGGVTFRHDLRSRMGRRCSPASAARFN